MLTTESSQAMKEKGKKIGIRAWITKPCSTDKLILAIERVLAAS